MSIRLLFEKVMILSFLGFCTATATRKNFQAIFIKDLNGQGGLILIARDFKCIVLLIELTDHSVK